MIRPDSSDQGILNMSSRNLVDTEQPRYTGTLALTVRLQDAAGGFLGNQANEVSKSVPVDGTLAPSNAVKCIVETMRCWPASALFPQQMGL